MLGQINLFYNFIQLIKTALFTISILNLNFKLMPLVDSLSLRFLYYLRVEQILFLTQINGFQTCTKKHQIQN